VPDVVVAAEAADARAQALTIAVTRTGSHGTQTIVYRSRPVYSVHERCDRIPGGTPGPIELFGMSPDRRWVLFAIDPMSSASLAAEVRGRRGALRR
jgi:hypothetical protein